MNHRQRPAPGRWIPARVRFVMGYCAGPRCSAAYVIDRTEAPWARARTCSESCRARLGNRGRNGATCEHCAVVESWRELVAAEVVALEVACADEDARPTTYKSFLTNHRYSNADEEAAA